ANPLNPPLPAFDLELEDVIEVEDTNEPEDETVPASVYEVVLYDIFWIIMTNVIPPDHVDDLPNPTLVIPEPVLVDEDEVLKEEEFEEEEEPQEEEDIDIDDE
nr:hypothetical protein [Tanacetum cinerariifolium]